VAWIIGIDEAGYGPNLGPLVMSAAAYRLAEERVGADLWDLLAPAVRRDSDQADGRLLIAESKVLYSRARGLGPLETAVLASLPREGGKVPGALEGMLGDVAACSRARLREEPWYEGDSALPHAAREEEIARHAEALDRVSEKQGVGERRLAAVVVCPEEFNAQVERWGSKGGVLAEALTRLIRLTWPLAGAGEAVAYTMDKHGGRNSYAALLQDAVPEGSVFAEEEGAKRSAYRVRGLDREVRLAFQPRADGEFLAVALASAVSKYLREMLMHEFNGFWMRQVPGLEPTAGYPGDAARYFRAIEPAMERLGIARERVWRHK
jgi:ribonuclease HII